MTNSLKPVGEPPKNETSGTTSSGIGRVASRMWAVWAVLILGGVLVMISSVFKPAAPPAGEVVVYCAQDQVYAEPIFKEFEQNTGYRVRAVFDSEAVKTVGIANRLIAEQAHPICDLYWGNEEMRTRQLAARGLFQQTNGWAAFGHRSRRIVINTNRVGFSSAPQSLLELTNTVWHTKVALAYPQFGTTSTHFHALKQAMGEAAWLSWCRALVANKPMIVEGNSTVVRLVGQGEAWIGLTDSDDIAAGQAEGLPVAALPLDRWMLLIPNTVAAIRNSPHPEAARQLFNRLQESSVISTLVTANALEPEPAPGVDVRTLQVDWDRLLKELDRTTAQLSELFLR